MPRRAPSNPPTRGKTRPHAWWAYLGLSSAVHAAALLALPAILGLSWWSLGTTRASEPREEVRITWLAAPSVESVVELPDEPIDPPPREDFEPDWESIEPTQIVPPEIDWEGDAPPPEPAPDPVPIPERLASADWQEPLAPKVPEAVETQDRPADPVPELQEESPETQEPPTAEPGETWDPEALSDYCPQPKYPSRAQRRKQSGKVLLALTVEPDGTVSEVEVLESSGHGILDRAAEKTLHTWRFQPGPLGAKVTEIKRWIHFRLP